MLAPTSFTPVASVVDLSGYATIASVAAKLFSLTEVGPVSSAYSAHANELVWIDTTSTAVPVTLPTNPADHTLFAAKLTVKPGSNSATITCGTGDHINTTTGGTTYTLQYLNQGVILDYDAGLHVWTIVADDLPLSQLDLRYLGIGAAIPESQVTNLSTDLSTHTTNIATLTGNLASATALAQKLGLIPALSLAFSGQTLYTYGHSYLASTAFASPIGLRYDNQTATDTGTTVVTRAISGSQAEDVIETVTNGSSKWVPGTAGVILVEGLLNSLRLNGNTSAGITSATNAYRAMMAQFTASSRIKETDASFVYTGTWSPSTPSAPTQASGGTTKSTVTQNDYVSITLPASTCYLLVMCRDAAGPTIQITDQSAGGTVLGNYDMSNGASSTINSYAIPINAPAGHVIRATKTDAGAVAMHVDALLPRSNASPAIVLVKENYLPNYLGGGPTYRNGSDAAVDAYNAILTTMASEFPHTVVATAVGWSSATCIGGDSVHPNNTGYAALTAGVEAALTSYINTSVALYPKPITGIPIGDLDAPTQSKINNAATAVSVAGLLPIVENTNTVSASGATVNLPDVTVDTMHDVVVTANTTINLPSPAKGKSLTLRIVEDATGGWTIALGGTIRWGSGVAPTLPTAANKRSILTFLGDTSAWDGGVMALDSR
jgi:hypothetical protein